MCVYLRSSYGELSHCQSLNHFVCLVTCISSFYFQELESALIAYEDLARVAVFLEQARLDERRYESGTSSYASHFQEIEEQAIYWLLCQLQKFIHELGQDQVDVSVTRDIMAMQLRSASSRALRHNRDFIIIRDSLLIIERFYQRFDILKQNLELLSAKR